MEDNRAILNVLILGGSGLLGKNLGNFLSHRGHRVTSVSRAASGIDLTHSTACQQLVAPGSFDTVINLIAYTDVDGCERDIHKAYTQNVTVVDHILNAIRQYPAHFIHISTDMVYDGHFSKEDGQLAIKNIYSMSKRMAELAIVASGQSATILRTNFFGKSRTSGRPSFSDWIITQMKAGQRLSLLSDVRFSPLHISTLCRIIELCAVHRIKGLFNAGARTALSKLQFGARLAELHNLDFSLVDRCTQGDLSLLAKRPNDMSMSSNLLEKILDLKMPELEAEICKTTREDNYEEFEF